MRLTAIEDAKSRALAPKLNALGWRFLGVRATWIAEKNGARAEAPSAEALLSFIELEEGIERRETRLEHREIKTGLASLPGGKQDG